MKNKVKLLFLLLFVFALGSQAQLKSEKGGVEISFSKTNYQFGNVKEESGDVNIEFEFTNTGVNDLLITDIKGEKGIEIKSWTKKAIIKGETGMINVVFHPKGNYNRVNKKITVLSNSTNNPKTILTISGNVVPIPGSIAAKYRRDLGNTGLMVKNTSINFGDVPNKGIKNNTLEVYNSTENSMEITFKNVPKHISVVSNPTVLLPKQEGSFVVDYNAKLNVSSDNKQKWGAQTDRLSVVINGNVEKSNRNSLSVRASIIEDFDSLTEEELAKAPKIEFTNKVFNFGTITQGKTVKHDFVYTNLGDTDLEIRYVKST